METARASIELRDILLGMLESAFQQNSDVAATQQMGVNLSNSIRKDGVVIIQNQNVEVYSRIVPQIVRAIKICDSMDMIIIEQPKLPPPISIPALPEPSDDPINDCCQWLFENKVNWQDMQDLMKKRYLEFVTDKFKTKAEAAKWLGVGSTYLSKLTREVES